MQSSVNASGGETAAAQGGDGNSLGPRGMIARSEFVRLLEQSLRDLGFDSVAEQLEAESGIGMQPDEATAFQAALLDGRWDAALDVVPRLARGADAARAASQAVVRQKYDELLAAGQLAEALRCLREELTPLCDGGPAVLHGLAASLLEPPQTGGRTRAAAQESRQHLLRELAQYLQPHLLLPPNRMVTLVEAALSAQVEACPFHNACTSAVSLLQDYAAGREQLPSELGCVLSDHTDEVWHIAFSYDGQRLASGSADHTAIIWRLLPVPTGSMPSMEAEHVLHGHEGAILQVAWAPDDGALLTLGSDGAVILWDTSAGEQLHRTTHHQAPSQQGHKPGTMTASVTTCTAWFPDGRRYATAGLDQAILVCAREGGAVLRRLHIAHRVLDLGVTADAGHFVLCLNGKILQIVPTDGGDDRGAAPEAAEMSVPTVEFQASDAMTSVSMSGDGEYLLANLNSHSAKLYRVSDLLSAEMRSQLSAAARLASLGGASNRLEAIPQAPQPLAQYTINGGRQSRFVLRSCFGGADNGFVAMGGEDCNTYVMHRKTGDQFLQLQAHTGFVNSVSWNPQQPYMLATASDDHTICIWMAPVALSSAAMQKAKSLD